MTSTQHLSTLPKAGTYAIDPAHTEVGFVARHLIGTKVRGRFTEVSGTFTVAENPEESTLEADGAGRQHPHQPVDAGRPPAHQRLPGRAEPPDAHPEEHRAASGSTTPTGSMTADLTIRGVTKPVDFDLEFLGEGPSMQEGKTVVAFSATRRDRPARLRRQLQPARCSTAASWSATRSRSSSRSRPAWPTNRAAVAGAGSARRRWVSTLRRRCRLPAGPTAVRRHAATELRPLRRSGSA